ncbi:MFS transporter [Actinoplanes sp. NBC_00393]|uniref:MFS transporter n=1 Tax=Actinoplanes sp. NBC_00393 TaxID=2975953 RepID=UPI002E1F2AD1
MSVPAALLSASATIVLILCTRGGAPAWTLFAAYVAGSTSPNLGAMARARWTTLYPDRPDLLHSANSLEQTLDEVCFMLGPVLAALLSTMVFPEAGLLVAAVLLALGTMLFAAQRRTEPPVHPVRERAGSPLRARGVKQIAATFLFTGVVFGSTEVVTVAYAESLGQPAAAGVILALFAGGSAVAGLVFGALRMRGRTETRFLLGVAGMALFFQPVLLAGNIWVLAALLFVAGLATAPTMIASMTLVQERVPPTQLNEGMTLTSTGLLIGISAGATAGGWVVDTAGAAAGYATPAVAAVLALLTALAAFVGPRSTASQGALLPR